MRNTILKIVAGLFIFGLIGPSSWATDKDTSTTVSKKAVKNEEKALKVRDQASLDEMNKNLKLTADQQKQVKDLLASQDKQINAVMQNTKLTSEQRTSQINEIRTATNDKIDHVLTSAQVEKQKQIDTQLREQIK